MTAHSLIHQDRVRRANRNGLLKLGWLHFWLLSAILAGMLGLVALVFFAALLSR
jgi:hypothetical protein